MLKKRLPIIIIIGCLITLFIYKKNADTKVSGFSSIDTSSIVEVESDDSISSGFIIDDSHIVSCFHSVVGTDIIKITLANDKTLNGTVVFSDIYKDLSLIEVISDDLLPVNCGDDVDANEELYVYDVLNKEYQTVNVLDSNYELTNHITYDDTNYDYSLNVLKLEGDIEKGFSGSPIFNKDGEVVGVITMKDDDYVYAISIKDVKVSLGAYLND